MSRNTAKRRSTERPARQQVVYAGRLFPQWQVTDRSGNVWPPRFSPQLTNPDSPLCMPMTAAGALSKSAAATQARSDMAANGRGFDAVPVGQLSERTKYVYKPLGDLQPASAPRKRFEFTQGSLAERVYRYLMAVGGTASRDQVMSDLGIDGTARLYSCIDSACRAGAIVVTGKGNGGPAKQAALQARKEW